MGHKVNPRIFRAVTTFEQPSRWFARKQDFASKLLEDVKIRELVKAKFVLSGIARTEIERSAGAVTISLATSKPGVIIGRGGAGIEELKKQIKLQVYGNKKMVINVNIQEVPKPDLCAELIVQNIIGQLEKRIPFRRVMKRTIEQVRRAGAQGVKLVVSGRLNGAEIARTESLTDGSLPLQTLRSDIDYSRGAAHTIYGSIGVKAWIYKGDIFKKEEKKPVTLPKEKRPSRRRPKAQPFPSAAEKPKGAKPAVKRTTIRRKPQVSQPTSPTT